MLCARARVFAEAVHRRCARTCSQRVVGAHGARSRVFADGVRTVFVEAAVLDSPLFYWCQG